MEQPKKENPETEAPPLSKSLIEDTHAETILSQRKTKIQKFFFGWVKDNYDKIFIAVLVIAFIVRFIIFLKTMNQPLWFDEAEYLATAKRWGLGLNVTDIWYYRRGFFWPLFCAIFYFLRLGESAIRFTEVLFSTGIVFVSYFLIKEMLDNKKYALFSAIGMAFCWVLYFFTARPMTDIPASFFLLTSLLFFWKGYMKNQGKKFIYLFGLFFALAILTRMQYAMFVPIFVVGAFMKEKFKFIINRQLWISIGIFILLMIPFFILYSMHFGNPVTDIASHYFGVNVESAISHHERSFSTAFNYFKDIPYALFGTATWKWASMVNSLFLIMFVFGVILFFADLILGFDKIFREKNIHTKFFIFLWIVVPYMILGYITNLTEQRYVIPMMPFLFLFLLLPLDFVGNLFVKNKIGNKKVIGFVIIILVLLIFIPNMMWGDALLEMKKTSYLEVKLAGDWIKVNSESGDIVITQSYPQIAYYSERPIANWATGLQNPEDHKESITQEEFFKFVDEYKPRYLMLSVFESHPDWIIKYPQQDTRWVPIMGWPIGNQQPSVLIYQNLNYSG